MQYDRKQALLDMIYQDANFTRQGRLDVELVCEALDLCLKTQDLDNFHKIILMRKSVSFIDEMLFLVGKYPLVFLQIMEDWSPGSQFMAENERYEKFFSSIVGGVGGRRILQVAISLLAQAKDDEEKSLRLKVIMSLVDCKKAIFGDYVYYEMRNWDEIAKKEKNAINKSDLDDIVDSVSPPKPEKHWEPEPNQEELDL